jgi:hypothetical protein
MTKEKKMNVKISNGPRGATGPTRRAFSALICMVAIVAAFVMQPVAKAQAGNVSTVDIISAGTLTNAATWTPTTSVLIDKQAWIGLTIRFQGDGSDTANIVTTVFRSADGVNFETSPPSTLKFTNALNNTTAVVGYFEIPRDVIGSVKAVKVSVQNAATTVKGTNATVSIVKKLQSP